MPRCRNGRSRRQAVPDRELQLAMDALVAQELTGGRRPPRRRLGRQSSDSSAVPSGAGGSASSSLAAFTRGPVRTERSAAGRSSLRPVGEAAGILGLEGVDDAVERELESEHGDAFAVDCSTGQAPTRLCSFQIRTHSPSTATVASVLVAVVVRHHLPLEVLTHDPSLHHTLCGTAGGSPPHPLILPPPESGTTAPVRKIRSGDTMIGWTGYRPVNPCVS
jgi:hypothetical protein